MALTVSNRRENVIGNMRSIVAQLVTTTGTDVWVSGLRTIRFISIDQIAGTPGNVGASAISSTGSVTLAVPAGATISIEARGW